MTHPIRTMFPGASEADLDELEARVTHTERLMKEQLPDVSDPELHTLYADPIFDMGVRLILWQASRIGTVTDELLRSVVFFTVLSLRSERAKRMLEEALGA